MATLLCVFTICSSLSITKCAPKYVFCTYGATQIGCILPNDPYFYAFAIPAVLVMGISKSGFGGVTGGLGVVLLAQAVSPATAAAVMLPLLCFTDIFGVRAYWKTIDWSLLKRMLPAAGVGTLIGALLWSQMSVPWLKVLLAAIAIGFPVQWWWKQRRGAPVAPLISDRHDNVRAWGWCSLSGFTSFIAHAGGPPVLAYLMPKQLHKSVQVGTLSFYFMVVNYLKLPQYFVVGQFTRDVLMSALVLAPFVPLGVWLGLKLHHTLSPRAFTQCVQVLMFCMGIKLAFEAWRGIMT
jgi:uncharacterized membrane protein YfcA